MSTKSFLTGTSVLIVATCLAHPAVAQEAAPPVDTGAVPDIVVTANKRSESINNVGLAITAVSGAQLASKGVADVSDLVRIEPSLQFSQSKSGTPVFTLRGVGYFEQSLSATPTVSIYQDEIAYPYPVMARGTLLDLERVEILKGPQGTLYGQNATGGAINFIAAAPTTTLHAGFNVSYGRFNDSHLDGFISGPITSTLTARLAGSLDLGGPWQKSITSDRELGSKDTQIGRLTLDWKPAGNFTATLTLAGWIDHSDTQAGQLEGFRLAAPQNISTGNINDPAFYLPAPIGSATFNAYPAPLQTLYSQPIAPNNARAADWLVGIHPRNNEHFYQANLRLEYALSDAIGLTSLTSYQHFREDNLVDSSGLAVPSATITVAGNVTTFSQEFRVHGRAVDGKFNWLIGANYASDKSFESDIIDPYVLSGSYSPTKIAGLPPVFEFGALNSDLARTYSVFGNAEYHLFDNLSVHGGIRYTESDQQISGCTTSTYPSINFVLARLGAQLAAASGGTSGPAIPGQCITLGPPPNFVPGLQRNTLDQHNIPWRVGIDYKPAPHTLVYLTVSRGYKAGSSPALGASRYTQLIPVTQESLLSYEGGIKTDLFGRAVHLDVSVFHYDYTNKQELGRVPDSIFGSLQALLNIPKSRENGAEASITVRPSGGLTLNGAVTYLDSKVTSNFYDYPAYPLGPTGTINFYGEAFPFTPKWSVQAGAKYEWEVTPRLRAFVGTDGSWQSQASAAFGSGKAVIGDAPPLRIKPYALLNLSAGIGDPAKGWRVEVWGKNITNTYYWHSVNYYNDFTFRGAGLPVTYGVRFGFSY